MSEWKEENTKRRDERQCKSPEKIRPHKKKKNKDKPYVVMRMFVDGGKVWKLFHAPGVWEKYKSYAKLEDAEKAIKSAKNNHYSCNFEYRIDKV